MSTLPVALFSLLILLVLSGCQGAFGQTKSAFDEARYADAVALLEELDRSALDPEERHHHALYAGLTHLSLGDLKKAVPYLKKARRALEESPHHFSLAQRGQLMSAWHSLGLMPGQPLRSPTLSNH